MVIYIAGWHQYVDLAFLNTPCKHPTHSSQIEGSACLRQSVPRVSSTARSRLKTQRDTTVGEGCKQFRISTESHLVECQLRQADFLRTYYPDVDIPAELIREELAEDSKASSDLQAFDPYAGDLLATLVCRSERTRKKHAFLTFPMGQTGSELSEDSINSSDCRANSVYP